IELGEIEAVLAEHPAVREVVVIALEENGSKRLVAYLVLNVAESKPTVEVWREWLQAKLPAYMVPSVFVVLDDMPLTANGKVDRKRLPVPESGRLDLETRYEAPQTVVEEKLVEIWEQVLGVASVGVEDNFFALGGDSILAIQVVSKSIQAGIRITPRQLFQYPTVRKLASMGGSLASQAEQGMVEGEVPLTPIQQWFFNQNLESVHHWNQSLLLTVAEPLNMEKLKQAIVKLMEHHDALRMRFTQTDTGWMQENRGEIGEVPVETIDLSVLEEAEQRQKIKQIAGERQASLNLSERSLVRVVYFNLGERPGRILLVIHHLVVDGVSWRILLEDLQLLYKQAEQGQVLALPAKTTSFQEWSMRLQTYAQTEEARQEAAYWVKTMEGVDPQIPVDWEGRNTVGTRSTVWVELDEELTDTLLHDISEVYGTQINEILLLALALMYRRWTGRSDMWVDVEGHERKEIGTDIDVSRTVGRFSSIYPVILRLNETVELDALIEGVKGQYRQIQEHRFGYSLFKNGSETKGDGCWNENDKRGQMVFKYLQKLDQAADNDEIFSISEGFTQVSATPNSYPLNIEANVRGGKLVINWSYQEELYAKSTIARLATWYVEELKKLIEGVRIKGIKDGGFAYLSRIKNREYYKKIFLNEISKEENCIVPIQIKGANPSLYFIHPVGGVVNEYFLLSYYLGEKHPVYAIQSPGLIYDGFFVNNMESMSMMYAEKIIEQQPEGPCILAGWSSGGIVAVETAKHLVKKGKEVKIVFVLDKSPSPINPFVGKEENIEAKVESLIKTELVQMFLLSESETIQMSQKSWKLELFKILKKREMFNFKINEKGIERFCEVMKANILTELNYDASTPYEGDLVVFQAKQNPIKDDLILEWKNCVKGDVTIIKTPGSHGTMLKSPNVQHLASHMARIMRDIIKNK
ncbi:condensation domain-containing protein, partial [Paenibacillus sp. Marseille-Q9583]